MQPVCPKSPNGKHELLRVSKTERECVDCGEVKKDE